MTRRLLWRSTVFVITLLLIYLAFPILIVPSSLPAIKQIVVQGTSPTLEAPPSSLEPDAETGVPIYQLQPPRLLTTVEKLQALQQLHRQGIDIILKR
jgi:cell division septal protein FtsQ